MAAKHLLDSDRLVAHRGDHEQHAENSLAAFRKALDSGARWLECDIQITHDALPVVFHDDNVQRMCNKEEKIAELCFAELPPLPDGQAIPPIQELLALLSGYPHARLFLEIKREILPYYSIEYVTSSLHEMLRGNAQVIPISMSAELLEHWWQTYPQPLGWVTAGRAPNIPLAYLLMPAENFLRGERPAKAETIAVYTVNDAPYAQQLLERGADLVETDHFCHLQSIMHVT